MGNLLYGNCLYRFCGSDDIGTSSMEEKPIYLFIAGQGKLSNERNHTPPLLRVLDCRVTEVFGCIPSPFGMALVLLFEGTEVI